jgi:hypothetical protein
MKMKNSFSFQFSALGQRRTENCFSEERDEETDSDSRVVIGVRGERLRAEE